MASTDSRWFPPANAEIVPNTNGPRIEELFPANA